MIIFADEDPLYVGYVYVLQVHKYLELVYIKFNKVKKFLWYNLAEFIYSLNPYNL